MDLCMMVIFLLIIQLTLGVRNKEVFLEKHVKSDVDMTPLCTNETDNFITKMQCNIQKGNKGSVLCSLRYVPGLKNESECGSEIKLMFQNQTAFLHLMDLTPEDSGMYYCECSRVDKIMKLHLNITVEESIYKLNKSGSPNLPVVHSALIGTAAFILTAGLLLFGFILRRNLQRKQSQTAVEDGEEMNPYAALQEPNNDLYQTINKVNPAAGSGSGHQCSRTEGEYENIMMDMI